MGILLWIVLGALAGWVASVIMKTDMQQGGLMNVIVGILGALIGGFIMNSLGYGGVNGFNIYSLLVATIGAVALIWIVKALA